MVVGTGSIGPSCATCGDSGKQVKDASCIVEKRNILQSLAVFKYSGTTSASCHLVGYRVTAERLAVVVVGWAAAMKKFTLKCGNC